MGNRQEDIMQKFAYILLIIIATNIVLSPICFASETNTNSVSGVVYQDINGNMIQDLDEKNHGAATVNISEVGSDLIERLNTDANGNFSIDKLTYGTYLVWSEYDKISSSPLTIEVNELTTSSIIALGLPNTIVTIDNDVEMILIQILLLPVVMN